MGFFDGLFRKRVKLTDADAWKAVYGDPTWTGEVVGPDAAMQLSAWWACIRLISETIATLPLILYRRTGNSRLIANIAADHPLFVILHDSPNVDQTATEFWGQMVAGLCMWGNCYAQKGFFNGKLVSLTPMPSGETVVVRVEGRLRYRFTDRGKAYDLPEAEVMHIRAFGMGGDMGLSPVAYARQTLGIATAVGKAAGEVYAKGLRSKGFFTFPTLLTPEQRVQAHKSLVERYSGPGAPNIGVLEAGVKFEGTNINPEDAEMLMSWRFTVEEICRWFGVPPILIGHAVEGQTMFGSGVEQINLGWLTYGLRPFLLRIEKRITKSLIVPAEQASIYAEHVVEGLLRADSKTRSEIFSRDVQNGLKSRNEARAKDNLPPVPGGDTLTVQSALIPLDKVGQQQNKAPGPTIQDGDPKDDGGAADDAQ